MLARPPSCPVHARSRGLRCIEVSAAGGAMRCSTWVSRTKDYPALGCEPCVDWKPLNASSYAQWSGAHRVCMDRFTATLGAKPLRRVHAHMVYFGVEPCLRVSEISLDRCFSWARQLHVRLGRWAAIDRGGRTLSDWCTILLM